jgi:pimeloyl-ACP methyl ester carboxylesterase
MDFTITPYRDDSSMKCWPSLAAKAFCLRCSRQGETIFYYDSAPENHLGSEASPVFVLIHGLGDEADSWRHLIPLLNSRGFRVLALDLPGFGRSFAPRKISIRGHVEALEKLLETAVIKNDESGNLSSPHVFLAGNSLGAVIAEMAAIRKKRPIQGIALLDGSIPGGPSNTGIFTMARILFSRSWYRAYRGNPEAAWASLYPFYADLDSMPQKDRTFLRQRVMARVESPTQERAFFATQRSLVWTYMASASRIAWKIRRYDGKLLLIWGEKDRIIPVSTAEAFRVLNENFALEIVPGAGHLPQQEKPEETARLLAEFAGKGTDKNNRFLKVP